MNEVSVFKKVFTGCIAFSVVTIMLLLITGCTYRLEPYIKEKLGEPNNMYKIYYDVHPTNLAIGSKCKFPPTIKIINDEIRNEDVVVYNGIIETFVVNPKEVIDLTAAYVRYGYEQSNIKTDEQSTRILHLAMKDMSITRGMWTAGLYFKMGINIPEINFQKDYAATESSMLAYAMAGAIHLVTRQIIDDRAIQDYILCKDGYTDKSSSQKLIEQELQNVLDKVVGPEKKVEKKKTPYSIQIRAYPETDINAATEFVTELRKRQPDVHMERVYIQGRGIWCRILLGHFANFEEATTYMKEKKIFEAYPESFVKLTSEGQLTRTKPE